MHTSSADRIRRWLSGILDLATDESLVITLTQVALDQGQRLVAMWKVADSGQHARDLPKLASDILDRYTTDAEALQGSQRYVLRASGVGGGELGTLAVRHAVLKPYGAFDSEPANANGTIAMLQRHSEGATRLLLEGFATILNSQQDQIRAQGEMIQRFQTQQLETFELQRRLLTAEMELKLTAEADKSARELEAMRESAQQVRKDKALQLVTDVATNVFAPAMLHKLTEGKDGKSELEASLAEARRLFAGKTPEVVAAFIEAAGELRVYYETLYQRFKPILDEEEKAKVAPTPAGAAERTLDDVLVQIGSSFVQVLQSQAEALQGLAIPLGTGVSFENLSAAQCAIVGEVAGRTWRAAGEPFQDPPPSGFARALWEELRTLERVALTAVMQALASNPGWNGLDEAHRQAIGLVFYRALARVDSGDEPDAPTGDTQQAAS